MAEMSRQNHRKINLHNVDSADYLSKIQCDRTSKKSRDTGGNNENADDDVTNTKISNELKNKKNISWENQTEDSMNKDYRRNISGLNTIRHAWSRHFA